MGRKVCILGTAHPFRGGMADFNERLAKAFQSHGDEVEIINFTTQYPSLLFPGKTQFTDDPPPKNLKISRKLSSVNPMSWWTTGIYIKKQAPDILMINYWLPLMAPAFGTVARIAQKNATTRIISVVHNIIPHEKRPGDVWFSKYFTKYVDGFLTLSKAVLKDLDLFDRNKPRLMNPHPLYDHYGDQVDRTEALQSLGLDSSKRYLLFFGFIRDYKGLDLLLNAMKQITATLPDVELIVAGEFYSGKEAYLQVIKEAGIEDKVHLHTTFIPSAKVATYFGASDLVVQPYKSATQSGVTQIAYHFDKPMVVTRVGGLEELVPDGVAGFIAEPNSEAIADAVIKYFIKEKEKSFRNNMKELKKKYSWEKLIDKVNALDEAIMKKEIKS